MTFTKAFVFAFAVAGMSVPAAAFTQIFTPDAAYKTTTNLLGVPAPDVFAIGDLNLTVTFSIEMATLQVGDGWATWGSPPDTENATPPIFWTQGETSVDMSFSRYLNIWGFEAQPNPFSVHDISVAFYDGATLLDTITRSIDGNAGARLLAAFSPAPFNRVVVSSDVDFAVAELRYQLAVPEPATWGMLIAGFGMVGFAARRRRGMASLNA